MKETHRCSSHLFFCSVWLETIAVEYRTCRLVVDRCVFLSLLLLSSSSRVCFVLRLVWLAVWLAVWPAYRYVVRLGGTFRIVLGQRDHSY